MDRGPKKRERQPTVDLKDEEDDNTAASMAPVICSSLNDLELAIPEDIRQHLVEQYLPTFSSHEAAENHVQHLFQAMKEPPLTTTCRIHHGTSTTASTSTATDGGQSRDQIQGELQEALQQQQRQSTDDSSESQHQLKSQETEYAMPFFSVHPHFELPDVFMIESNHNHENKHQNNKNKSVDNDERQPQLLQLHSPPQDGDCINLFPSWPDRHQTTKWPMDKRVVLVDRFCGEAVLRGSDIFVKGIMSADMGIGTKDIVAVYADVGAIMEAEKKEIPNSTTSKKKKKQNNHTKLLRGMRLEHYRGRRCVYLGLGMAGCKRVDFFNQDQGLGVRMLQLTVSSYNNDPIVLPPFSGLVLPSPSTKVMFQNLPSMLVAHALDPQPGEVILDMCAAPGGKTRHVANLLHSRGGSTSTTTIVACDVSRKKMLTLQKALLDEEQDGVASSCITPLALNTTKCCIASENLPREEWKSVQEILQSAARAPDGLLSVSHLYPESFDKIILDPPCSALGLRPKLALAFKSLSELQQFSVYQRKFAHQAVRLLKPGGTMTYSTCTFHADENERMVHHILQLYADSMELVPITVAPSLGRPGLIGMGLDEAHCQMVRRFDPQPDDPATDTIGFFLAKFRKKH